jgi:hypothetical protein
VRGSALPEKYKSPNQSPRPKFPQRNRLQHASELLSQLREAAQEGQQRKDVLPIGVPSADGITLEFESHPNFDLTLKSLDLPSKGIELLAAKQIIVDDQSKTIATVFVPNDKVELFIKKVEEYRDQETKSRKPKNAALVDSIEHIRLAVVRSLWTDLDEFFPEVDQPIWWEVWLRATQDSIPKFQNFARVRDIPISNRTILFPDRHVILAYATPNQFVSAIDSIGFIAELRKAKESTADFLEMPASEQREWVTALSGLTNPPSSNCPAVCILDTGVHRHHPLIEPFLPASKTLTCNRSWGVDDHQGHGTEMAGLALYGDLENALLSTERIDVPCELESVKILPRDGENSPELYGSLTEEAVSRATISEPERERIVCMAVTATDSRDRGQPSSWSASVDKICVGESIDDKRHLVILSAGNIALEDHINYPEGNLTDGIHDPGQSWNALTVGAFTEKADIAEKEFRDWTTLAPPGDIAPGTTTSLTWQRGKWPIKPDIVFEGGNAAINPTKDKIDYPNSLALLTTNRTTGGGMFTWTADTSAASAKAAHLASQISVAYPDYWPETIRALMIHSAEWTQRMRDAYPCRTKPEKESLLRTCGFGVPDANRAIWSASNALTLIAQDDLKPFDGNAMNEMNLHQIPWPEEVLRALGETKIKMRVTLSYFIEPNPARRGWEHKFRYQSHGLRFDVKTPTESLDEFKRRLNRERWEEEAGRASVTSISDSSDWVFGKQIRSKGSLHSDIWEGTAVALAERSKIAVFPVVGWWREKHAQGHTRKNARYSLIVSISTPDITTDLYTPVETEILTAIAT